ncbi:DNA polymerase III subunit gamma/tau [Christensenellaceae bacterium OttesenSCG-928-M15]|nr:DNA polymerase III subunit gamma/tau [Christensenellaceae bacterium OttesenSCG-928-M15]
MSYQALYRKYRPQRFSDVVGQEHITTILKNQIQNAHASHAYLFCGSRGTGKTSTAKIFARALNCLSPVDGDACGHCEACRSMEDGNTVDVIEIDAASNNGVDDVRSLIEQARFTPLSLKYKVYIIDEVHMLTGAASNALLKTLEEPPGHVVFLLATTEPQKILATVISRCQRYDFRRLSVDDIAGNVRSVVEKAGGHIDEEGLNVIARAADGGMRDALSLADQCLAFCGDHVSLKDVYDVLGSMDLEFLFDMAEALIASDAAAALRKLDGVVRSGRDLGVFAQDVTAHIRALLLAQTCGDCRDLLDCTKETMERYIRQAKGAAQERLIRALELLTEAQNKMKWLGRPRVLLETVLVRICRPEDEQDLMALMDRVGRLEQRLEEGTFAAPHAAEDEDTDVPVQEDAPPWDMEEPPIEEYEEKAPQKAAQAVPPKAVKPGVANKISPPEQPGAGGSEAEALWEKLKEGMRTENLSLFLMARNAKAVMLNDKHLTVYFPPEKKNAIDMLNIPRNLEQIQKLAKEMEEELTISFRLDNPAALDEQTKELMDIFGDKLTIRD